MNDLIPYVTPTEPHASNPETGIVKRFIEQDQHIKSFLLNHPDRKLAFLEVCGQTKLGLLLIEHCFNKINFSELD